MQSLALLPLLVASAFAGELIAHGFQPLPQYTQEQNTATGEYGYSYSGGPSSKTEFRTLDGTTTGAYSYVDAHGILQTVNYIADEFGFRAAGSNIPTEGHVLLDAPDVAVAKAAHLAEHSRQSLQALSHYRRKRGAILPIVAVLPVATSHQSRIDIHHGARLVAAPAFIAAPLYRKKRGIAYAAPLPPTSAKIYDELASQHLLAKTALPLATPTATVFETLPLAAPATIIESFPISSSHQSRFQIHKSAKIIEQVHQPIYAAAAPIVTETFGFDDSHHGVVAPVLPAKAEAVAADSDAIAVESA